MKYFETKPKLYVREKKEKVYSGKGVFQFCRKVNEYVSETEYVILKQHTVLER